MRAAPERRGRNFACCSAKIETPPNLGKPKGSPVTTISPDLLAILRWLEQAAVAALATFPAEAVRLAYLAAELRRGRPAQ